jgi:hypothetical protein
LYRIRYVGDESTEAVEPVSTRPAASLRQLRQSLEVFHGTPADVGVSVAAINTAVPCLGHSDRGVRFAARVALEHQPTEMWRDAVLAIEEDHARVTGLVGLARAGQASDAASAIDRLIDVDWSGLSVQGRLDLLRAYGLAFVRLAPPSDDQRAKIIAQLNPALPATDNRVNRELSAVLIYLRAEGVVSRTVELLTKAPSQEDQIHFAFVLRDMPEGWTEKDRMTYFNWFNEASSARGGMSFGGFLDNIRSAAKQTLSEKELEQYAEILKPVAPKDPMADMAPRAFVQEWKVTELESDLASASHDFDFDQGRQMFAAAQCYKCHRMGVSGGILGPDLTGAGGRFSPKDMLTAIVEPNKEISDQYAATQFLTDSGEVVTGKIINMNGDDLQVLTNLLDPSSLTNVKRADIEMMRAAPNSLMPAGLIDTLSREEILDLLGYLRAGGDPESEVYSSKK